MLYTVLTYLPFGAATMSKQKKPPSIRIKLEGEQTPADLRLMLSEAVDELEARGFKQYKNCNLYFTPVIEFDGTENLDTINIKHPYRSAADEHGV